MAKDPAFLFYYQDFIFGTGFMEDKYIGQYIKILCHLADKGRLSEEQVLSICKASAIHKSIQDKLEVDNDGYYFNERLRGEVDKRKKFTESRRKNAASAKHMHKHMEDENENEDVNVIVIKDNVEFPFDEFWNLYDKKVGRPKCEKKWNNLTSNEQALAMIFIPEYKTAQPEKRYRKNPETFLNNKGWHDEIITNQRFTRGAIDADAVAAEIKKYS